MLPTGDISLTGFTFPTKNDTFPTNAITWGTTMDQSWEISADADRPRLMTRIKVLFSPATPIHKAQHFSGRAVQVQHLIDAILEQGRHAILFGERGVGKTSLTNVFNEIIGSDEVDLFPIRKQTSPGDTFTQLWRKVFRDIKIEKKRDEMYGREEVDRYSAADLYDGEIEPDDVIRELTRANTKKWPVIIFDEFDKLENDKN